MQPTWIKTDDTLREVKTHGMASYPFEYYYDKMCNSNNYCIDWHWHDEFEWVFAQTGDIECLTDTGTFQLEKGDAAFINSKVLHRFKSEEDTGMPNILFSSDFIAVQGSPVFSAYIEPVIFSNCSCLVFRKNQEKDTRILMLLHDIFHEAQSKETDWLNIQIAVLSLWRTLFNEYAAAFDQKRP